jgi:hypothetical protein
MDYILGYFELETRVLEPLENPFGPKVLPMSSVRCVTHVSGPDPRESGGREGIRTPGLLIANEDKSKLRRGATIT